MWGYAGKMASEHNRTFTKLWIGISKRPIRAMARPALEFLGPIKMDVLHRLILSRQPNMQKKQQMLAILLALNGMLNVWLWEWMV